MPDQITQILQQALQRNTKSTVLRSLEWLVGILSASAVFASKYEKENWLAVLFAILDCITIVIYIFFFCYFAIKNPDLLRSEKFTLSKMAIERSISGDTLSGFIDPTTESKLLSPSTTPLKKEDL